MARSAALKAAQQRYDATRNKPVPVRFFFEEIEQIDATRGNLTRNAWIRKVVLEAIKQSKKN